MSRALSQTWRLYNYVLPDKIQNTLQSTAKSCNNTILIFFLYTKMGILFK